MNRVLILPLLAVLFACTPAPEAPPIAGQEISMIQVAAAFESAGITISDVKEIESNEPRATKVVELTGPNLEVQVLRAATPASFEALKNMPKNDRSLAIVPEAFAEYPLVIYVYRSPDPEALRKALSAMSKSGD